MTDNEEPSVFDLDNDRGPMWLAVLCTAGILTGWSLILAPGVGDALFGREQFSFLEHVGLFVLTFAGTVLVLAASLGGLWLIGLCLAYLILSVRRLTGTRPS